MNTPKSVQEHLDKIWATTELQYKNDQLLHKPSLLLAQRACWKKGLRKYPAKDGLEGVIVGTIEGVTFIEAEVGLDPPSLVRLLSKCTTALRLNLSRTMYKGTTSLLEFLRDK